MGIWPFPGYRVFQSPAPGLVARVTGRLRTEVRKPAAAFNKFEFYSPPVLGTPPQA